MSTATFNDDLVAVLETVRDAPLQAFLAHLNGLPGTVTRLDYPQMCVTARTRSEGLRLAWTLGANGRLELGAARIPWSEVRGWRAWLRFDELHLAGIGLDVETRSDLWRVEVDVADTLHALTAISAAEA